VFYRRRRNWKKKQPVGSRRKNWSRRFRRRPRLPISSRIHTFKRMTAIQDFSYVQAAGSAGFFGSAFTCSFSSILEPTEFETMFDQYRISGISVHIIPRFSAEDLDASGGSLPVAFYVVDYDDATIPINLSDVTQHGRCKRWNPTRPLRVFFRPSCLIDYYQATAIGFGVGGRPWLDLGSPAVPHYGFKFALSGASTGAAIRLNFSIYKVYYFQMRYTR